MTQKINGNNISTVSRRKFGPAVALALMMAGAACATDVSTVLIEGPHAKVTVADMEADALNIPPHIRDHVLADPVQVRKLAEALFIRRNLAARASQQGFGQSALDKAKLELAYDAAMSELYLTDLVQKTRVEESLAERLARNEYNANKERFAAPAEKRASQILIANDTPDAKSKIDALYQQLQGGADFAKLASENSQDVNSAFRGGDLGYFGQGTTSPEFEAALNAVQEKGAFSEPFQSPLGWHIVKFVDARGAGTRPFDEVKELLMQQVHDSMFGQKRTELIEELKSEGVPNSDAIEGYSAKFKAIK